jgi:hypothetical protein
MVGVQYGLKSLLNDASGDLDNDRFSILKNIERTLPNDRKSNQKQDALAAIAFGGG